MAFFLNKIEQNYQMFNVIFTDIHILCYKEYQEYQWPQKIGKPLWGCLLTCCQHVNRHPQKGCWRFCFSSQKKFWHFLCWSEQQEIRISLLRFEWGKDCHRHVTWAWKEKAKKSGFFISGFSERWLVWNSTEVNFLISSQGRGVESRLV